MRKTTSAAPRGVGYSIPTKIPSSQYVGGYLLVTTNTNNLGALCGGIPINSDNKLILVRLVGHSKKNVQLMTPSSDGVDRSTSKRI